MDPWVSLCELVDTRLNRLLCQAVVGTPDEALAAVREGLRDLARALRNTPWPDIADVAGTVVQVAGELTTADDVSPALAHIQKVWAAYQHHLVGEIAPPSPTLTMSAFEVVGLEVVGDTVSASSGTAAMSALDRQMPAAVSGSMSGAASESDDAEDLDVLRSDPELATMFIAEALDHLSSIEATVLQLEADPTDQKLLNDVFRPFHTVKGNAGALGVKSVQAFAHKVENLLDLARGGALTIGAEEIEIILESVDVLTGMIGGLSARLAGQAWQDRRHDRIALAAQVERVTSAAVAHASAVAAVSAIGGASPALEATVAVSDLGADLFAPIGVTMAPPPSLSALASLPSPLSPAPERIAQSAEPVMPHRRADDGVAAVKVDTRKLDSLVDMVGELVIIQSLISEDPALKAADERLSRNLAFLARIASDLQRNAMSMRMVPVRQTFQKMSRLVRDLSKKSGKPVDLVLVGEDTELDRKVVEEINDPLMHMIRNSIDHGIEPPDQRRRAGKPAAGRLSLSAAHQGGNIVIALTDDGRGLHAERILAKAVERGLVPAGQTLPLSEIHQLIFRPGFSTAEKVTEISGRGVGMDVVRRNIEALRGRIEIHTEQGQGTTFSIKLPLTLAIVEGLLLRVGEERFVMPTFSIRESLRPLPERVHTVHGVPRMIQVRDTLLPLICLGSVFSIPGAVTSPCEGTVVVVEDDGRHVAMLVDQLVGKQEVVIKPLGPAFAGIRGVAGGAILGDGRIGLILDAGGVIGLAEHGTAQAA